MGRPNLFQEFVVVLFQSGLVFFQSGLALGGASSFEPRLLSGGERFPFDGARPSVGRLLLGRHAFLFLGGHVFLDELLLDGFGFVERRGSRRLGRGLFHLGFILRGRLFDVRRRRRGCTSGLVERDPLRGLVERGFSGASLRIGGDPRGVVGDRLRVRGQGRGRRLVCGPGRERVWRGRAGRRCRVGRRRRRLDGGEADVAVVHGTRERRVGLEREAAVRPSEGAEPRHVSPTALVQLLLEVADEVVEGLIGGRRWEVQRVRE
ncbi:MAG: hypothetical protein R3362_10365, partial [Rhodothermales bacterium]|nr:hypothetical protein [Rhodothermales bacterium]